MNRHVITTVAAFSVIVGGAALSACNSGDSQSSPAPSRSSAPHSHASDDSTPREKCLKALDTFTSDVNGGPVTKSGKPGACAKLSDSAYLNAVDEFFGVHNYLGNRDNPVPKPKHTHKAAPKTTAPNPDGEGAISDGTYLVGTDIPSGTYKTKGPDSHDVLDSCYFERATNDSGSLDSIIDNDILTGPGRTTVSKGQLLTLTGGCFWVKQG